MLSQTNKKIPVKVEVPIGWMRSRRDGERNRLMFESLKKRLKNFNLNLSFEKIPFDISFRVRTAPKAGFTLSYHSVGNVQNVWRIKETPVQYYYSFERFGFSGWSELSINKDYHLNYIKQVDSGLAYKFTHQLRSQLILTNTSKYKQTDKPFTIDEPFVFYSLQKPGDIVSRLYRLNAFKVLQQASFLAKKKRIKLVVKRHPYCYDPRVTWALFKATFNNPYVIKTSASIHKILPLCSSVLVANSGVGFEALIHGKQVFSFGSSEYELATTPLNSIGDIDQVFSNQITLNTAWINRFVYYFLTQCCFNVNDAKDIDNKLQRAIDISNSGNWLQPERAVTFPSK